MQVSCDVTLCYWVSVFWCFEGMRCLHLQGANNPRTNMHYIGQVDIRVLILLVLLHHLLNNTVSHPRRTKSITVNFITILSPFISLCNYSVITWWSLNRVAKYHVFGSHLTVNTGSPLQQPFIVTLMNCCCLHSGIAWHSDMLAIHACYGWFCRINSNMIFIWTTHKTKISKVDSCLILTCPVHYVFVHILRVLASCSILFRFLMKEFHITSL